MPNYLVSYWNGAVEAEVNEPDAWEFDSQLVWEVGATTLCGSTTFVSSVNPGPYLYPDSTFYPGGY